MLRGRYCIERRKRSSSRCILHAQLPSRYDEAVRAQGAHFCFRRLDFDHNLGLHPSYSLQKATGQQFITTDAQARCHTIIYSPSIYRSLICLRLRPRIILPTSVYRQRPLLPSTRKRRLNCRGNGGDALGHGSDSTTDSTI